jgi:NAD(P)-dependent dehydrogenase (short-subunit alcohol dehydrogenase family)
MNTPVQWVRLLGDAGGLAVDVRDDAVASRLASRATSTPGGLDLLPNAVATARPEPVVDITVAHGQRIGSTDLVSMLLVAQAVAKALAEHATASVSLSMPTVNGMTGQADRAGYNAWKAAVLLKTMAVELVNSGLRANFLCPLILRRHSIRPSPETSAGTSPTPCRRKTSPLARLVGLRSGRRVRVAPSDQAWLITTSELAVDGSYSATL